jgi:hypothetical protein
MGLATCVHRRGQMRQRRFGRSGLSGCDRTADSHPGDQAHTTRPRPTVHHCAGRAKMPSHPKNILITRPNTNITAAPERWPSGRRRSPAKGVYVKSVSRVRIPSSPPLPPVFRHFPNIIRLLFRAAPCRTAHELVRSCRGKSGESVFPMFSIHSSVPLWIR